jgi:hypothetical protein
VIYGEEEEKMNLIQNNESGMQNYRRNISKPLSKL